ncbi:MAG: DUF7714 family protein [Candidatus Methanomethylophilaceae archaeon]|jgi:hypothetical protein
MHCKDISVMEADFPLTEEGIRKGLTGHMSYVRAKYTVMSKDGKYAVAELIKDDGEGLFRKINSVKIISLPEDTVFVDMPEMDVLNTPERAELQKKYPGKTVVVRGMFSHISFVHDLEYKTLRIVDSVPPYPSKMDMLVRRAFESGYVDIPLVTETFNADMSERIKDVKTEGVMFPCRVSGLKSDKPYYFLDESPELKHDVTLIGCETSLRIFRELYGKDVPLINACPRDLCPRDGVKTIARCCRIRNGHILDGDTVLVPWGATVPEVAEAINALFG